MDILASVQPARISRRRLGAVAAILGLAGGGCAGGGCVGGGCVGAIPSPSWTLPRQGRARLARWAGRRPERSLFNRYAQVADRLPWLPLTSGRTPVAPLTQLGVALGLRDMWIKRDDQTSPLYGGNKVRKNEFLLADAVAHGAGHLLTMGGLGSHHCASVAAFGRQLGLPTTIVQAPQPVTDHVRHMLRLQAAFGATQLLADNEVEQVLRLRHVFGELKAAGQRPYFIWAGGSTPLGTLGYVDAGLELAEQIQAGLLPEPEALFVASGSCGSHAGLACAMQLAGLRTKVIGVRVVPWPVASIGTVRWLAERTLHNLALAGATLGTTRLAADRLHLDTEHLGDGYGHPLPAAEQLRTLMWSSEQIRLEPTYTAKTLAAMVAYAIAHPGHGPLLLWHTFSSAPEPQLPPPTALPASYHRFFA